MRSDRGDRDLCMNTAQQLRRALLPHIAGPIDFSARSTAHDWGTDGWGSPIASFSTSTEGADIRWEIDLWLDTGSGHPLRTFYVGFWCDKRRPLQDLIKLLPSELKPKRLCRDADVTSDKKGCWLLRSPLPIQENWTPSLELYSGERGQRNYFGVYDLSRLDVEQSQYQLDLRRASDFIVGVLSSLHKFEINVFADDYSAVENRRVVATHLHRERDPRLAKLCKERDGYRCQICKTTFEEVYGQLGLDFAEAHHKVPLNQIDGKVENTVDALITVCANCHRMLHRKRGDPGDVEELKKLFD